MIDYLYANGCSWTAGHGIQDHEKFKDLDIPSRWNQLPVYAWPAALSKLLGVDHTNHGQGAGSNKRMVRTTIDWLHTYPKEKYKSLLVVLGWTTVDRNEFYIKENEDKRGWCICNASQLISSYGYPLVPDFSKDFLSRIDDWHKDYLTTIFNNRANYTYFFQEMWLMSNLLENLGIKYVFFNSLPWKTFYMPEYDKVDLTKEFSKEIEALKKPQILSTREGIPDERNNVMSEFVRLNSLPMAKDHHTMIEGHEAWAKHLHAEINQIYT